jgi:NitT/TauT family transport system substrate-binding protein
MKYPGLRLMAFGFQLAIACIGLSPAFAVDHITVAVPNPPHISNAIFFLADELGFWRDEGLEVELLNVDSTGAMIPQIAAKRVTIGYPNPEILVLARQPGKDNLPLRFFYNVVRSSIWEVTVLEDSPVHSLQDLKGAKLGVTSLGVGNIPLTRAMFNDVGLTVGKDVDLVAVGISAIAKQALVTKQIDALNLFDMVNAQFSRSGVKLRQIPIPDRYKRLFSNGFIAHEDTIKTQGAMLGRFGRAWSKAVLACDANTEACVRAFWRARPALRPPRDRETAEMADNVAVLKTRLARMLVPEGTPWGAYDDASWKNLVDLLHEQGQISTDQIPVSSLYSNAFVPEYNHFDRTEVIDKAKALKEALREDPR